MAYNNVLSFAPDSMDQQFGLSIAGQSFLAGLIHMTVASDQDSRRPVDLRWLQLLSAPHVSHPLVGQLGLAHIEAAGVSETVEMCRGDRAGIHMILFIPHLNGQCKSNKVIPYPIDFFFFFF